MEVISAVCNETEGMERTGEDRPHETRSRVARPRVISVLPVVPLGTMQQRVGVDHRESQGDGE